MALFFDVGAPAEGLPTLVSKAAVLRAFRSVEVRDVHLATRQATPDEAEEMRASSDALRDGAATEDDVPDVFVATLMVTRTADPTPNRSLARFLGWPAPAVRGSAVLELLAISTSGRVHVPHLTPKRSVMRFVGPTTRFDRQGLQDMSDALRPMASAAFEGLLSERMAERSRRMEARAREDDGTGSIGKTRRKFIIADPTPTPTTTPTTPTTPTPTPPPTPQTKPTSLSSRYSRTPWNPFQIRGLGLEAERGVSKTAI